MAAATMESAFTDKDTYLTDFDSKLYLETYYNPASRSFFEHVYLTFVLRNLHDTFSSGGLKGKTLIDVGCGPTIHQIMSACECFKEIIATDFSDPNRQEYEKWLKNESEAFDWSPVGKMVCGLEGDRQTWAEKETKIRTTVTKVLKCDVMNSKPLDPVSLPQADCVLSSLCLEAACKDLDAYRSALKNITTLLKTGGHLVLCGILGSHFYMVGQKKFFSLFLDEAFLRQALSEAGYVIKEFKVQPFHDAYANEISDCNGHYFVTARKEKSS